MTQVIYQHTSHHRHTTFKRLSFLLLRWAKAGIHYSVLSMPISQTSVFQSNNKTTRTNSKRLVAIERQNSICLIRKTANLFTVPPPPTFPTPQIESIKLNCWNLGYENLNNGNGKILIAEILTVHDRQNHSQWKQSSENKCKLHKCMNMHTHPNSTNKCKQLLQSPTNNYFS